MVRRRVVPAFAYAASALVLVLRAASAHAQQPRPAAPDCTQAAAAGAVRISCATLAEIDAAAQEMVASGQTAGLAVAVVRDGRVVFNRGYGKANLELDAPVTPSTVFRIFSITKTFTAAAIMQLVEGGRLSLDDRLAKFIPAFPRGGDVTLRQLLSHTSGIHDYARPGLTADKVTSPPDSIVAMIARQEPHFDFEPGTRYAYSNSNYALLARVLEIVSGREYGEYMAENVFARAGLRSTAVDHNPDVVPGRASGYMPAAGGFVNGIHLDMSFPFGAGTIRSTTGDLASWFTAFFAGRIVSPASVREMTTPARVSDGRLAGDVLAGGRPPGSAGYYGLGTESGTFEGHRWVGHGGAFPSFSSQVSNYVDDGVMVIVLANTGGVAWRMEHRAATLIFAH